MKAAIAVTFAIVMFGAAPISPQEYNVTVTSVRVWVKATDHGKPVEGLKAEDFVVYEDNQQQPLSCFEEIRGAVLPGPAPQTQAVQTRPQEAIEPAARKFVIFLDLLNTSPSELLDMRPHILEFLDQIGGKNWDVMLAVLLAEGKLGIEVPFTRNVSMIRRALYQAKANATRDVNVQQHQREIVRQLELAAEAKEGGEQFIQYAYSLARSYAREEETEAEFSLAALGSFGDHLGAITERDQVAMVYISGGFNSAPGRPYFQMIDAFTGGEQATATSSTKSDFDLLNEVKNNIGRLNRSNITVYAINTRGLLVIDTAGVIAHGNLLPPGSISSLDALRDYQDSLAQIAQETGGISFENSQNFQKGFDKVLVDMSQQYLLCYTAPLHRKAGEYHKIKVVSKRAGVDLRHRRGYFD